MKGEKKNKEEAAMSDEERQKKKKLRHLPVDSFVAVLLGVHLLQSRLAC